MPVLSVSRDVTNGADSGPRDGETVTLSTGHTVDLPLSTEATITGAVFSADREGVVDLLPAGLVPVRTAPDRAAVAFLCVEYHRVGRGEIKPYDEFGVLLPTVPEGTGVVPDPRALLSGIGGYVWYLPVTSEPARALGVEPWGYPKVVAGITHEDRGRKRRTTVDVDGERLITIKIDRPPTLSLSESVASYTVREGLVLRESLGFSGSLGIRPFGGARFSLGTHPRAGRLRQLRIGGRALACVGGEGKFVIHAGRPLPERG
jgi:hypothetical protein